MAQYETLLFKDPEFWHSLGLSLVYALFAVPLGLLVSLGTALLLDWNLRYIGVFRVLFYLPSILPVAASSMMWVWLLDPNYGIVNHALAFFGLRGSGWLQDPHWAIASLILISLWGFGGGMLIFLAGLKIFRNHSTRPPRSMGPGLFPAFFTSRCPASRPSCSSTSRWD